MRASAGDVLADEARDINAGNIGIFVESQPDRVIL
jgi:hypothetical protein